MKNINEISKDCLIWLFNQFSLQELIELRKVCLLWTVIIEDICKRKRSLKLFGSINELSNYSENLQDNKLQFDKNQKLKSVGKDDVLVGNCWKDVICLFPNVQNLVYYDSPEQLSALFVEMPDITNLTLGSIFNTTLLFFGKQIDTFNGILEELEKFKSLKQLHLIGYYLGKDKNFPEFEILPKLESFSIANYYGDITLILKQLGEGLRKLTLNVNLPVNEFQELFKTKSAQFVKLTHLSIQRISHLNEPDCKMLFHFICENFVFLVNFEFESLKTFSKTEKSHCPKRCWNVDVESNFLTENLAQIQTLQLTFDDYHQETFPKLSVQSIFPKLESLTVWAYDDKFLNSTKSYLVDELKLNCKMNFKLVCDDNLFYMGNYREQYKIEQIKREALIEMEEMNEEAARQARFHGYDDSDDSDRYYRQTSSDESYIDPDAIYDLFSDSF